MDSRDDAELFSAMQSGERAAFDALVARHSRRLWAIGRAKGMSATDAEDAVQTVWLALLSHHESIRKPESLSIWLTSVLKHEVIRVGRLGGRTRSLPDEVGANLVDERQVAPEDAVVTQDRRARVRDALAQLSEACQELLRLLFSAADLSYADISLALDRPVGAIGPTRKRCLSNLRDVLDRDGGIS